MLRSIYKQSAGNLCSQSVIQSVLKPSVSMRLFILERANFHTLLYIYKSLFTENSVATQKQYRTSINTKYNDQVHHIIILH